MANFVDKINEYISAGSKSLKGPTMAALVAAILQIISTLGNVISGMTQKGHGDCTFEKIRQFDLVCLAEMWTTRDDSHGWSTFFSILDCFAMLLMIWVFDGIRTINKDKDIGSLMVGCMEVATVINVITTLIETGLFNTARYVATWKVNNYLPDLEIAYMSARGAFNWLYTIDDFIMVVPYFWCFMLSSNNDKMPASYGRVSLVLAICSFFFFLFGILSIASVYVGVFYLIIAILQVLLRFVWLFQTYAILKKM